MKFGIFVSHSLLAFVGTFFDMTGVVEKARVNLCTTCDDLDYSLQLLTHPLPPNTLPKLCSFTAADFSDATVLCTVVQNFAVFASNIPLDQSMVKSYINYMENIVKTHLKPSIIKITSQMVIILHFIAVTVEIIVDSLLSTSPDNKPQQLSPESAVQLGFIVHILYSRHSSIRVNSKVLLVQTSHEELLLLRMNTVSTQSPAATDHPDHPRLLRFPGDIGTPAVYRSDVRLLRTIGQDDKTDYMEDQLAAQCLQFFEELTGKLSVLIESQATAREHRTGSEGLVSAAGGAGIQSTALTSSRSRDEAAGVYMQTVISIARFWNAMPSSVDADALAAHALLSLLHVYCRDLHHYSSHRSSVHRESSRSIPMNSAGFTAIVPIATRLLDRYQSDLHRLGLLLLYETACLTPPGLLATFQEWVLPHIFAHIEIVSDDWSRLLVARLLHALLACDTHSSIALQHMHLYLDSSLRQLNLKPTVEFAWPFLTHLHPALTWIPEGVLACHLDALLQCHLQLLNVWHLPLQSAVMRNMHVLAERTGTLLEYDQASLLCQQVATELVRVLVFYHSDQRDISGASEESMLIIRANCVALARQWRKLNAELWDAFIENVLTQVRQTKPPEKAKQLDKEAVERVSTAVTSLQSVAKDSCEDSKNTLK